MEALSSLEKGTNALREEATSATPEHCPVPNSEEMQRRQDQMRGAQNMDRRVCEPVLGRTLLSWWLKEVTATRNPAEF